MDGGQIGVTREEFITVVSVHQTAVPGLTLMAHMSPAELDEVIYKLEAIRHEIRWLQAKYMFVRSEATNHIVMLSQKTDHAPEYDDLAGLKALCGRHDQWYSAFPGDRTPTPLHTCKRCRELYLLHHYHS